MGVENRCLIVNNVINARGLSAHSRRQVVREVKMIVGVNEK